MKRVNASWPLGRAIARETLLLFSNFALRPPSRGRQPLVTDGSGNWAFTNVGTKECFVFLFVCQIIFASTCSRRPFSAGVLQYTFP